jgi:predicted nucleic acid-binding protein
LRWKVREWFAGRILPVTDAIAERWRRLEAQRQRLGLPLNTADGQIAATALEHGLSLVTRNVNDFRDLGVVVLNPWNDALFETTRPL